MYFSPECHHTVVKSSASGSRSTHGSEWQPNEGPLEFDEHVEEGLQQEHQQLYGTRSQPGKTAHNYTRHFAVHHYRDRAQDAAIDQSSRSSGGVVLFPVKLHKVLTEVEREGLDDIVSWVSHGRCFQIHNPKAFLKQVLPRYFKMSKPASFQRQLYLYRFQRLTRGRDRGCYYHECFLRGRVDLAREMNRIVVKGTIIKAATNPDQEPNLYSLPSLPTERLEENDYDGLQSDCTVEEMIDQVDHSFELQLPTFKAPSDDLNLPSSLITFDQDELEWTDFLVPDHDFAFNCRPNGQAALVDASIDAGMILDFCSDWAPTTPNLPAISN